MRELKIAIILNGVSRKKKKFYQEIYPALTENFTPTVFETRWAGDAEELAAQAVEKKFSIILSAGGDGTLHQVLNGVLKKENKDLPAIGLIPLGSANDFARTCLIRPEPTQIIQLLMAQAKPTDVGKITCIDQEGKTITRYFINACSVGMGPEVVRRMAKSGKRWGPSISYFSSIISTFITHRPQQVQCKTDAGLWAGKARVVAIANGKSFGNSIYIAPGAVLDDGILNSFVVGEVPLWKFLMYLQSIKGKKKIIDPMVHYSLTLSAELSAPDSCVLESEGEIVGYLPAAVKILPGKINFLR